MSKRTARTPPKETLDANARTTASERERKVGAPTTDEEGRKSPRTASREQPRIGTKPGPDATGGEQVHGPEVSTTEDEPYV